MGLTNQLGTADSQGRRWGWVQGPHSVIGEQPLTFMTSSLFETALD